MHASSVECGRAFATAMRRWDLCCTDRGARRRRCSSLLGAFASLSSTTMTPSGAGVRSTAASAGSGRTAKAAAAPAAGDAVVVGVAGAGDRCCSCCTLEGLSRAAAPVLRGLPLLSAACCCCGAAGARDASAAGDAVALARLADAADFFLLFFFLFGSVTVSVAVAGASASAMVACSSRLLAAFLTMSASAGCPSDSESDAAICPASCELSDMTLQASPWNNPADAQTQKAALGFGDVTLRGADWRIVAKRTSTQD